MNLNDLIVTKQEQLRQLESNFEEQAKAAGAKVSTQLDSLRAKRDDFVAHLEALRGEATDRVEILRMGVESAYAELQTAFQMATENLEKAEPKS